MVNIEYTLDRVGNIAYMENLASAIGSLGGLYQHKYGYDNIYRLTDADGNGSCGNWNNKMKYTDGGRIGWKQTFANSAINNVTAILNYGYCNDYQPHAVKRMFDYKNEMLYDMRWDEAGNLGQVSMGKPGEMFERGRFLFWTEDCCGCEHRLCQSNVVSNRMHAAVDDKYFSYYVYDHSGERRLKLTGDSKLLDVNADFMATYTVLNEPTLYPSSYMVLNNKGYTNVTEVESRASSLALPRCSNVTERKHYYAGTDLCASREQSQACLSYAETKQSVRSNRVAARLGGGGLDAQQHVIAIDDDLQWKADKLFKQSLDHVNHRVLGENDLNCIMRNKFSPEVLGEWIEGIPYHVQAEVAVDNWQFKDMIHSMLDDPNNGKEKEVYFYHSDHLGSASWITDYRGMAVQHIQYLPYGEPYINQRPFGYSERFTFTGKERDEETGYGYFGARYMDHELMTMWLSVDPMADKYPSISPYNYCMWNPVKLIDPDGRDVLPCSDEAYEMILRSIPIEARAYVKRNSDGYIDRDLINSYSCESQNFNDLKELVNMDDCTIEVMLANNYEWVDEDGNIQNWDMPYSNPELDAEFLKSLSGPILDVGQFESPYKLSTGEYGDAGVALRPTSNSGKRSTNGNIQVYINEKLSVMGQVENFAHEFFGHAYLYAKTRSTILSEHDFDTEPGTDSNTLLKNRIKHAQNEAASYNR